MDSIDAYYKLGEVSKIAAEACKQLRISLNNLFDKSKRLKPTGSKYHR